MAHRSEVEALQRRIRILEDEIEELREELAEYRRMYLEAGGEDE